MSPEKFHRIREFLQLTQSELAKKLGCSREQISKMEHGVRTIQPKTALALFGLVSLEVLGND